MTSEAAEVSGRLLDLPVGFGGTLVENQPLERLASGSGFAIDASEVGIQVHPTPLAHADPVPELPGVAVVRELPLGFS